MNNNFKKLAIILALTVLFLAQTAVFATDKEISVVVGGQKLNLEQKPIKHDGRVMVPLREVMENIGFAVIHERGEINCVTKYKTITLTTRGNKYYPNVFYLAPYMFQNYSYSLIARNIFIDGKSFLKDEMLIILNNKTMISARTLAEVLGAQITWDSKSATVTINIKIPEIDRLTKEDIADNNAFTIAIAREVAAENLLYRHFERLYASKGYNYPSYENGVRSQNIEYSDDDVWTLDEKVLNITKTGAVSFNVVNHDYSAYPQYPLAAHAKYLPFQAKYDGYLGGVAYARNLEEGMIPFNEEYSSRSPEGTFDSSGFDVVNTKDGTEYFLIFPKYKGTKIEITFLEPKNLGAEYENVIFLGGPPHTETIVYNGEGPVLLCANTAKSSYANTIVKFTLGDDSVQFCPHSSNMRNPLLDNQTNIKSVSSYVVIYNSMLVFQTPRLEPRYRIMNFTI